MSRASSIQVFNPRSAIHCCGFVRTSEIYALTTDEQFSIYKVGEGHFDDGSTKPSGAATPVEGGEKAKKPRKSGGKKAKTAKQRLAMADGDVDMM